MLVGGAEGRQQIRIKGLVVDMVDAQHGIAHHLPERGRRRLLLRQYAGHGDTEGQQGERRQQGRRTPRAHQ
ncbi:hypothetical protein D3C72_987820 [compost metagenome]